MNRDEFESYVICSNCGKIHTFIAKVGDAGRSIHITCNNCSHGLNFSVWSNGNSVTGYTTNVEGTKQ